MLSQPNHTNHQVPKADDAGRNAPDEATTAVTDQAAQRTQKNPQEVCGLVQDRLTKDMEAVTAVLSNRLVEDFVADQSDPVRQRLQEMIDANRRMGELVIRIAEQMSRILPGQPIQNA